MLSEYVRYKRALAEIRFEDDASAVPVATPAAGCGCIPCVTARYGFKHLEDLARADRIFHTLSRMPIEDAFNALLARERVLDERLCTEAAIEYIFGMMRVKKLEAEERKESEKPNGTHDH